MVYEIQDRVSGDILKPLLKKLCKRGEDAQLKRVLSNHYEVEIADALEKLKPKHQSEVLRMLDHERATEVVSYLEGETLVGLLKSLSEDDLKPILNRLDANDRTYLFESADAVTVQNWMLLLAEAERREAENLLSYAENSAGHLMTTGFMAIHPDWTVQDTMNYIRRHGDAAETLHTLYVVDKDSVLLDEITLRQLVMAQPSTRIESLMDHNVIKLEAGQNRDTIGLNLSLFWADARFRLRLKQRKQAPSQKGVLFGLPHDIPPCRRGCAED